MKKSLIGCAILLTGLIGIAFIAPAFVDWSSYRALITEQLQKQTGRDVIIGGDMSLSILPQPVVRVMDIQVSNPQGASQPTMASVRQLDIALSWGGLMQGDLHFKSLRLIDPRLHLETLPNGQGNWVMTPAASASAENPPSPTSPTPTATDALPIQIDDFIIERGTVIYSNPMDDTTHRLDNINSRFALQSLQGPFELAGTAHFHDQVLGFDATLGALRPNQPLSFSMGVQTAFGQGQARLRGHLDLSKDDPRLSAHMRVTSDNLANTLGGLLDHPTMAGGLSHPFTAEGTFAYDQGRFDFDETGLSVALGPQWAQLGLAGTVSEEITFDSHLTLQSLAIENWLNAPRHRTEAAAPLPLVITPTQDIIPAPKGSRVSLALAGALPPESASATTPDIPDHPFGDTLIPENIAGTFSFNIGALRFNQDAIRQIQVRLSVADGALSLEQATAELPGAAQISAVGIAAVEENRLRFDGGLDIDAANLRKTLQWLSVDTAQVPSHRLRQAKLSTEITATQSIISLNDTKLTLDDSQADLNTVITLKDRPSFGIRLRLDHLTLDEYLINPERPSSSPQEQANTQAPTMGNSLGLPPALSALDVLNDFDANIDLGIDRITYQGQSFQDVTLNALIFNGDLTIRTAQVADAAGVTLSAEGGLKKTDQFYRLEDLTLTAQSKNLSRFAPIFNLEGLADWRRFGAVEATITATGSLLAPSVQARLTNPHSAINLKGTLDLLPLPTFKGDSDGTISDLGQITRAFSPEYRPRGATLAWATPLTAAVNRITFPELSLRLGQGQLTGTLDVALGTKPTIALDMRSTDTVDLTPFLNPQNKAQTRPSQSTQGRTPSAEQQAQRWSQTPIDLAALTAYEGTFSLQSKGLKIRDITVQDLTVQSSLKEGMLRVDTANFTLWEGQIATRGSLNATTGALSAQIAAQDITIQNALKNTDQPAYAKGQAAFTAALTTQGQSQAQWVQGLTGTFEASAQNLILDDASTNGSVFQLLSFVSLLSGADTRTSIANFTTNGNIAQGVLDFSTLNLDSQIAQGRADGTIDLPNWTMDIDGSLNVQQNLVLGLLAQRGKVKSDYPFAFSGPIDAPNIMLDSGSISSGGGLVIPLSDKLEDQGVGTLLRGVLGAAGVPVSAPPQEDPAPTEEQQQQQSQQPSQEEQLIRGIGDLFRKLR